MNLYRNYLPLAALAAALTMGGCHSSQPDNNQSSADQMNSPSDNGQTQPGQSRHRENPGSGRRSPAQPPPPSVVTLPAGTEIRVRLDQDLSSKDSQPGEAFQATVADDVLVNGNVVIPKSSRADGTVVDAKGLGKFKGGAMLAVRLDRVHTRWGSYPVLTGTISRAEKGKGRRSAEFIGGGAALGALIGGLTGGGKGAAIGALAGGGAGTAGSVFTGNKQIVLPAETLLTFRMEQSVRVTESGRDRNSDRTPDPNSDQSGDPQLKTR